MTWRVFATPSSQPDIDKRTDAERVSFADDLFAWVEDGPPRINRRTIAGADAFQDDVPSGVVVTYFVDETVPYVAILQVRRR